MLYYSIYVIFKIENANVSILENGKEYTIDEFIEKNPGTFVNLVRMQSSQRFFPQ